MAQNSNSKMILTIAVVTVLVFALGYAFMSNGSETAPTAQAQASQAKASNTAQEFPDAPDFTLKNLDNQEISLSDYKGKVVFLNFWATWCAPCRQEIPYFIDLIEKYGKDGFVVLGVALDPREFEKVPGFVDQMGINYPVLLDETGISQLYGGIRSIPTTFVIDRDGKAIDRIVGSRPHAEFEKIVNSTL